MDEKTLSNLIREAVRQGIKLLKEELRENLKAFATKEDFLEFERRLSDAIEKIREGVRLYLYELERQIVEIKSKLRFYDFDYIARQNDTIIKIYEEKTVISNKLKEHETRLEEIGAMLKSS
ncbi:hypothetical protein V4D30_04705 [Thermodesulfovibrio sp. 3907-1M]|uniref:Uncharacterized protein n=1 Tax=Thermodesulfovibrio autotrophicus TaxID=3118333 RepID=A0AAU8GYK6_9BACT